MEELFAELREKGLVPTDRTWGKAIRTCGKLGDLRAVDKLLQQMKDEEVPFTDSLHGRVLE